MHLLLLSLGCAGKPLDVDSATLATTDSDADTDADTDTDTDTDADSDTDTDADADSDTDTDVTEGMLYGTLPSKAVPVPDFLATNLDRSRRTPPDLIGHPSVLWFYPAAGTSG